MAAGEKEKEAQMKALISRIADDIWNRGDLAVVDEVMSANGKYHGPHVNARAFAARVHSVLDLDERTR